MNKKVLVIVLALAAALLALPMSAAYATKPMPVSGMFMLTDTGSTPPIIRQAGESDNQIWVLSGATFVWTGDIEGTCSWEGRWVMHNFGDPEKQRTNTQGHYTIEATVDGEEGTLYIEARATGGARPRPHNWVIIGGTGELANLHGRGTFVDNLATPNPFDYLYSGQVHFDP